MSRSRSAFTLLEVLVCLAIIGILVALLLPAVQYARESGQRITCANQLKQMGIAFHSCQSMRGTIPYEIEFADRKATGEPYVSWRISLLPFLEEKNLFAMYNQQALWHQPANSTVLTSLPAIYLCPNSRLVRRSNSSYENISNYGLGIHHACGGNGAYDGGRLDTYPQEVAIVIEVNDEHTANWVSTRHNYELFPLDENQRPWWDSEHPFFSNSAFKGNHGSVFPILHAGGHVRFQSELFDSATRQRFDELVDTKPAGHMQY